MKVNTSGNLIQLLLLSAALLSCAVAPPESSNTTSKQDSFLHSTFALPQQQAPPEDIQTIQLYRSGNPHNPPVIELNSEEKLTLSFDYLDEQNRQFRVKISHRTQHWEQSNIGPNVYLDSFFQLSIVDSRKSLSPRPSYYHVEYEFPNSQLKPAVSGNYLLEVYGEGGNELLFSMPFFITEDEGELQTRIEPLFALREDRRAAHQLFSTYNYPDFVEFPQFDLSLSYVQNQFWGRMHEANQMDTSTPGKLNGHLERDAAFIADYNFHFLDLTTFDADGRQIVEYQPGYNPPRILLRRDVLHLEPQRSLSPSKTGGRPPIDRSSNYAQVNFFLDADETLSTEQDVYIVGGFNNWIINDLNRLKYNQENGLWEGRALVKQGHYTYKYVLVINGEVDALTLDNSTLTNRQNYLTFAYYKDPKHRFDRLLKVNSNSSK